ncbi:hypothetical protein LTR62_002011 [Meristemomyces frigidus]|uniref:Histidine kinase n=1 Tax=Meristemomyces frigidus TaxID=1508187 RepID=A0AAN7TFW9_9PEZI|nr:hypothetical protein LTR62_002011 [Meristemomyces frigidus]
MPPSDVNGRPQASTNEKPSVKDDGNEGGKEANGTGQAPRPQLRDATNEDPDSNGLPPDFMDAMRKERNASDSGKVYNCSLPGEADDWEKSALGPPDRWPTALRSYVYTLSSLDYPAAIFWSEELIMLHNASWASAGGKSEQGQKQLGSLGADAFQILSTALRGGRPKKIHSSALLRSGCDTDEDQYVVLVSPLFGDDGAVGLLAQLMSREEVDDDSRRQRRSQNDNPNGAIATDMRKGAGKKSEPVHPDEVKDRVPLDKHPFFHRFAELIPSGLAVLDHKAQAIFVNQQFYELTTHREREKSFMAWPQSIHPDDYDRVMDAYREAFTSGKQLRTEFRTYHILRRCSARSCADSTAEPMGLDRPFIPSLQALCALGQEHPWRLLLLSPLGDENLDYVSLREHGGFVCSIVDISSEKGAELSERNSAKEAQDRRQQQERFIDMISHEIRNPLSAVLHCSENLTEAVSDKTKVDVEAIEEAIETINLCIQHQRNIVDDVLSFSKLDASMLTLHPSSSQPRTGLANTLKMFQPEFRKQGIDFGFCLDTSYEDEKIDWVFADMARMGQVLVNLITNAIKFTAGVQGREKKVEVSLGASYDRPDSYPPNVIFFGQDTIATKMDSTHGEGWGNGDAMYMLVAVRDTGIGISQDGQQRLFERFQQVPKTENKYGGSGLGLNISRKLCHLHGGEIGVSSAEGHGSTFGFFFRVRRSSQPADGEDSSDIDSETLSRLARKEGAKVSNDVDENELPDSINAPPVIETQEAHPYPGGELEERYEETREVAQRMKEKGNDDAPPVDSKDEAGAATEKDGDKNKTDEGDQLRREETESKPKNVTAAHEGRILLVEDNVINQRIVHRKLKSKGYDVTTANNGQDAVDIVRAGLDEASGKDCGFGIVLMDQEMPVLDGNGAARAIRELEKERGATRVPILGVTANVRGVQQDEMKSAGMDDVIGKPYKIQEMIDLIEGMKRPP